MSPILTWSQRNEAALALLQPTFADRVRRFIEHMRIIEGEPILITQGLRTWAQQDALEAQRPRVTRARGGSSWHNFGLAVDLCPDDLTLSGYQLDWDIHHPVWKKLLAIAPRYQLAEGAVWRTFPDNPHFYPEELAATPDNGIRRLYLDGEAGIPAVWAHLANAIRPAVDAAGTLKAV